MSESKKPASKPIEEIVAEPVLAPKSAPKKSFRVGTIFWGALFVFVGTLLLLDNLDVLNVHFMNLWQLWPVLIIGAGVSMFSLRGWVAAIVSFVLVVTLAGLAWFVAVDNSFYQSTQNVQTKVVTLGDTIAATDKEIDITLNTGAIDLTLSSGDTSRVFSAEVTSSHLVLNQDTTQVKNGTRYVALNTDMTRGWWLGPINNSMDLELTERLPLSLHIETGASSLVGDLSHTQLKTMSMSAGASTVDLKFGTKQARQDITFAGGASKITLRIPTGTGVRVETENGLSSTDFEGISKVSDDVYESTGFSSAMNEIVVYAKLGVSSFEIVRY